MRNAWHCSSAKNGGIAEMLRDAKGLTTKWGSFDKAIKAINDQYMEKACKDAQTHRCMRTYRAVQEILGGDWRSFDRRPFSNPSISDLFGERLTPFDGNTLIGSRPVDSSVAYQPTFIDPSNLADRLYRGASGVWQGTESDVGL